MACECAISLCTGLFSIAVTPKSIAHSRFPHAPAEWSNPVSQIQVRSPRLATSEDENRDLAGENRDRKAKIAIEKTKIAIEKTKIAIGKTKIAIGKTKIAIGKTKSLSQRTKSAI